MANRTVPLLVTAPNANLTTATVTAKPPTGYEWAINHIGLSSTSLTVSVASVFQNSNYICGSGSGNGDSADGAAINVKDGDTITITWSNLSPLSVCKALLIVDEINRFN